MNKQKFLNTKTLVLGFLVILFAVVVFSPFIHEQRLNEEVERARREGRPPNIPEPWGLADQAKQCQWVKLYSHPMSHTAIEPGFYRSKNLQDALKWCRTAARNGSAEAQAVIVRTGADGYHGTSESLTEEELGWYQKAIDQNVGSEIALASLYEKGVVVPKDPLKARELYLKVYNRSGNDWVAFDLARNYELSDGVAQDLTESFKWYMKAAENGLTPAMINIAQMYLNGRGTKQDFAEAYFWSGLWLSFHSYSKEATAVRNQAAQHLDPEQISGIEKLIKEERESYRPK